MGIFYKFGNYINSYLVVKTLIEEKLKEKGIEADVKIDKDGNIMYTMTPLPEEKRVFKLPPMVPPKQETPKERWEREERFRREQKERDNDRSKPNGIPLHQERSVTIYYTEEEKRVKTKDEILKEIKKADKKLDEQEGIKNKIEILRKEEFMKQRKAILYMQMTFIQK